MDQLNAQTELIEARRIVRALAAIRDRLTIQDVRFVESWETALARRGDTLPVGPDRLALLRRVRDSYFPQQEAHDKAA